MDSLHMGPDMASHHYYCCYLLSVDSERLEAHEQPSYCCSLRHHHQRKSSENRSSPDLSDSMVGLSLSLSC